MKLIVVEEGTRATVPLDGSSQEGEPTWTMVRIGRAIDNDIRLSGALASRHHCRLEQDKEGIWVVDLSSANGTMVNGQRIDRRLLGSGDVIGIGGARMHLEGFEEEAKDTAGQQTDVVTIGRSTLSGDGVAGRVDVAVFARLARELVREVDLEPLLRQIVDAAVDLVEGERGFLLFAPRSSGAVIKDPKELEIKVARTFDGSDIPVPSSRISMGIAKRVLERARPLLSVDAAEDERFDTMQSVEDLRLRSVLCLPIRIEGRIQGLLYVDNRLRRGAFTEDDLDLAELLAEMAAIAIKNARLVGELREQNQQLGNSADQIKSLNEQLGHKIRDRDSELSVVRRELDRERGRYDYASIVGASHAMRKVFSELDRIVETELPVFIHGESGTGKELVARAVHFNGARKDRPFVVENCAALPDSLLESELFGHTRGAFTGADRAKKGLLQQADGGTLFLDEIGDMSPEMQKKLLRVLQEGEVRPLGSNEAIHVDVRLLAASHRDLEELVKAGTFREDLFYRINVLTMHLPALRERRDDVPLLSEKLLARAAREAGRQPPELRHEVVAALAAYDWPGNVRELENEMRRVMIVAGEEVRLEHLTTAIRESTLSTKKSNAAEEEPRIVGDLRAAVARFEQRAIEDALAISGGNKSQAAKALGISRFALQRKLEKYGLASNAGEDQERVDGATGDNPAAATTDGSRGSQG
ncbi:MAG: transcriptional regulator with GAF, ATPase, and Fis domain [Planctomycetota bacterium]|jgi:transcriptional regulator with GAF, ATPase, and Fis domain